MIMCFKGSASKYTQIMLILELGFANLTALIGTMGHTNLSFRSIPNFRIFGSCMAHKMHKSTHFKVMITGVA